MKTLLKDMPEFAERIEDNYLLGKEIEDVLEEASFDNDFEDAKDDAISAIVYELKQAEFTITGKEVSIDDPELLAQAIWKAIETALDNNIVGEINNKTEIATALKGTIGDFVNHNYTFRGI